MSTSDGCEVDRVPALTRLLDDGGCSTCWVPADDDVLTGLLADRGWTHAYVDVQMRRRLTSGVRRTLPSGLSTVAVTAASAGERHAQVHAVRQV